MVTCHCGSLEAGGKAVAPLKRFGTSVVDTVGEIAYCQLNSMLDAAYPKGALNYWKSNFLTQLSDDAIETMIACFAECPTPMGQLLLEHVHGAAAQVGVNDTAFPHRSEGYNFLILCEWLNEAQNPRDSFFHEHIEGRHPLDPSTWIENSAIPLQPTLKVLEPDSESQDVNRDLVQSAIQTWRKSPLH